VAILEKHFQSGHDDSEILTGLSTAARCRSRNRINVGTQAQLFDNLTVACHNASLLSADRAQVFTAWWAHRTSVAPTGTVRA